MTHPQHNCYSFCRCERRTGRRSPGAHGPLVPITGSVLCTYCGEIHGRSTAGANWPRGCTPDNWRKLYYKPDGDEYDVGDF